jgi:hypothetical protein
LFSSPSTNDNEDISDVDARVLKSMLSDGTFDQFTEDEVFQLLQRASNPKSNLRPPVPSESVFESKTLQTLLDTKLWKALSAKTDDLLETLKIFVENRIERDTKLLAALGIFLWDRVVQDVARALPAASSSGEAVGRAVRKATRQLGSSSSFREVQNVSSVQDSENTRSLEELNLYEELNTPLDEIRSVTQSIQDILKGEKSTSKRGIRSVAPAGQRTRTERQQRAYQKRKQTVLKREKEGVDIRKVAGTVVDVAYEVRRDFQVETNKPGYKTERVRTAIAAGAATTSRVLAAARDGQPGAWRNLFAASENEKGQQLLEMQGSNLQQIDIPDLPDLPEVPPEPVLETPVLQLPVELLDEQDSVISRLKLCIEKPEITWLTDPVSLNTAAALNSDNLRDVVTAMIIARDDLSIKSREPKNIKEIVTSLKKVKSTIDAVLILTENAVGSEISKELRQILYGYDSDSIIQPTLVALDEIQDAYQLDLLEAESAARIRFETAVAEREQLILEWERLFDERERIIQEAKDAALRIDAEIEANRVKELEDQENLFFLIDSKEDESKTIDLPFQKINSVSKDLKSSVADGDSVVAEIVFDDIEGTDVDEGYRTVVEPVEGEEEGNIIADATLRSLDIVLTVSEKAILFLPGFVQAASIASSRLENASRGGLGKIGWSPLEYAEKGSKRY